MTVEEIRSKIRNRRLQILEEIEKLNELNDTMIQWQNISNQIDVLINEDKILKQELEKKIETKQFKATS